MKKRDLNENLKNTRKVTSGFAFRMISGTVLCLAIFALTFAIIGYLQFTDSLTTEYNDSAFRTAESASTLIDGSQIDTYLAEGFSSRDYSQRWNRMNTLCQKQNVTLIYVIKVDTTDYNSFLSIFNTVNETSGFTPWDVGFKRATTNEQYRQIYMDIYENGLQRGTIVRRTGLNGNEAHITSLIPIVDDDENVTAIMCVERPMDELTSGRVEYVRNISIMTLLLTVIIAISVAIYLRLQFVKPIKQIGSEAARFAEENTRTDKVDLKKVSRIYELRELGESIERMEDDTLKYMSDLTTVTAERERIAVELTLATKIQANILPNTFPPYPHRKDFDIFASMDAAKEVGGDFYDFYLLDNDRLGFLVADVSGKGVPAALFMMRAKTTIKSLAESGRPVNEILKAANNTLCEGNDLNMFVTSWLGIIDLQTGVLSYANAGHNPPLIRHENGKFEYLRSPANIILAAMEGVNYKEHTLQLLPGDEIFLYTDGVTEANDVDNNLFGEERLIDTLNQNPSEGVEARCYTVRRAIEKFVGDNEQFDDITMLSVRVNFFQSFDRIITSPDTDSAESVWHFIDKKARKADLTPKISHKLQIIVDEIYSNILRYSEATKAEILCRIDEKEVTLVFKDDGTPYDPTVKDDPDITLSAEERSIGGLGIFMVKRMASSISYLREDNFNVLEVKVSTTPPQKNNKDAKDI